MANGTLYCLDLQSFLAWPPLRTLAVKTISFVLISGGENTLEKWQ